jgi:arginyl-tRNA synthetase
LEKNALDEVRTRHPELSEAELRETAHAIATGALRYFLLKFTRNSVIAFDFKEALSFEGETGPYCQYAAVRANSIFRKLDQQAVITGSVSGGVVFGQAVSTGSGGDRATPNPTAETTDLLRDHAQDVSSVLNGENGNEIWSLLMLAGRLEEANAQAAASAEPAVLAKYTFNLARAFNLFYHRHRIIAEEDATKRAVLIAVANYTRQQLTAALARLGITVPERM